MSISAIILTAALNYGVPPEILSALCWVESEHKPAAINYDDGGRDSIGLCQLQLRTARYMGYKGAREGLLNPKTNAKYAAKYLKYQLNRYGCLKKAIVAYNAGRYIPYTKYVDKVLTTAKERYNYDGF